MMRTSARRARKFAYVFFALFALGAAEKKTLFAQSSAEAAVRLPVTWASGTGAPTVKTQFAPMLSLNLGGALNADARASLDTRISNTDIQMTENGVSWSGGTLTLVDVVATLGWRPLLLNDHRLSFEIGVGATVFAGSRSVAPFKEGKSVVPIAEGTLAYDLPFKFAKNAVAVLARESIMRMGGADGNDAVQQPGYVHRVSFGLRVTHQ
ncbi:MAG: hypothetical protein ABJC26_18020 [Gemmatimonadaceae bacterium]